MPIFYPAQTSLMPVVVALSRFLENEGWRAILGNYPFWYLGSTPFHYLTGPILPSILVLIHHFLPRVSLFEIFFFWIAIAWIAGGLGVYLLVKELSAGQKGKALLAAIFYLFGPIVPVLFRFADGLYLTAFSFLPFLFLFYLKFLKKTTEQLRVALVILVAIMLLIDTLIIPSLLLGMGAVFLAQVGWKKAEEKLKESLVILGLSFLIVTIWYAPGYWLTLLFAPSFGGQGLGQVILWLGKLLPIALATSLALVSGRFFKKREVLRDFCFYWFFIFGFLTLMRFLSNPAFWLDWSAYGVELQLGIAMVLSISADWGTRAKTLRSFILLSCAILLFTFAFNSYVLGTLRKDITQTVEYQISNQLNQMLKPGERVFLSGTTAFWLNSFFDVAQVRGGRDQVSLDGKWREATWEIREGANGGPALRWLKSLGISYLVVHSLHSGEYYHDFKQPEKFKTVSGLKKVWEKNGDIIYHVE